MREALLAFAQSHPEIDCLGLEVHRPGVGHLLLGAHAGGLNNLRIISHDAVEVLQHQFMRNMVRVLVGTMLEVAGGRRTLEDFASLLDGAPRERAGETAPPHALYLASVAY